MRDKTLYYTLLPFAAIVLAVFIALLAVLAAASAPALSFYGLKLFTESRWAPSEVNPRLSIYGLLAPIYGTLVSATIAVLLALPVALSLALVLEEYSPPWARELLGSLVEVMAGLPTIVYGLWGLEVLAPLLRRTVYDPLHQLLGFIPLFSCRPITGYTIATAGILLSIMVLPYMTAIIRDAYKSIPYAYREAALAIGANRYEYARIMLGMIKPSIIASLLLGFGRAAGETVAVALVVGNVPNISPCIFTPGYTVSSLIANQFSMAPLYPYMMNVLFLGGLVLLLIGVVANLVAVVLLERGRMWSA